MDQERSDRSRIKEEFIEITVREETCWRQKARLKWLKERDNNTKFFHSFANAHRTNNCIAALNIDGDYCDDTFGIEEEVIQFFKELYMKKQKIEAWFSSWSGKSLTSQQAALLEVPFPVEDIKEAIFSMAPVKAPGLDGFTMGFFQDCCDIVQPDLVDCSENST